MADWSTYLAGLFGNNPNLLASLTGDFPQGILGGAANSGGPTGILAGPKGILAGAAPSSSPTPEQPGSQSLLGPLNAGQAGNTISPQFAQSQLMDSMDNTPPMDINTSLPTLPPLSQQGGNTAPLADNGGGFWSRNNSDGTQDILGGLLRYDPAKDLGRNNRLGLMGATFADMGAQIGGHPEAAKNLQLFTENQKKVAGQQALADAFSSFGQPAPALQAPQRLADSAAAQLPAVGPAPSQSYNAGNPGPTGGPVTVPPAAGMSQANLPRLPQAQNQSQAQSQAQPQQFDIRSLAPKLAAMAASGQDISPILSILKEAQPDFSTDIQYTHDNRPYVLDHRGNVKFLDDSGVSRPVKLQVAGNGVAYDENSTAPGTDFSDKGKPFNSATGAANAPVQNYEIRKATAGAELRLAAQGNVDPKAVDLGIQYFMANGGKMPPTARSPALQQAIMAGANDRMQAGGITMDSLVAKGQDLHAGGRAVQAFDSGKQGDTTRSLNVAVSHLDTLGKLADALNNGDVQQFNRLGQFVSQQTGSSAPTNFDTAKQIVGDEITKAVIGAGGTGADRDKAQAAISRANSPAQLKGAIKTYQQLLGGQLGGLKQQYETSTGRSDFGNKLSADTKRILGWQQPPSTANLPRIQQPPGGTISGVKWKFVAPGGQ